MDIGQFLAEILVLYHPGAWEVLHELAGVPHITRLLAVMVSATSSLPPVHEEEDESTEKDADEGEVVACLLICKVHIHVASERKANHYGDSHGAMDEAPATRKVLGANLLKSEDF